jgi:sugar lactone lactonase YvrE
MTLDFTCLVDLKCRIGESPVYDERTNVLYFVDILDRTVYRLDVASNDLMSWNFESEVGSIGLAASGRIVVALRHSVILFDPASEAKQEVCRIEEEQAEKTRLNDGRVGPDGAFFVGSMDDRNAKQTVGVLYRVDPSGRVERKVEGLQVSNGLAWTANGEVMFHSDSRGPWIDRWRFDRQTGAMSDRTRFATLSDVATGRPDGGSCDAEGYYWSAGVSAGRINRFAPDGRLVEHYDVPVVAPTMPVFGGKDFRTLYLTSLREGRDEELLAKAPLTGSLLAAPAAVAGFPSWRFLDI